MKLKRYWFMAMTAVLLLVNGSKSEASILLNEIFADPPSGLSGDANGDGVRSGADDEFIELLNFGEGSVDLTGWSISDSVSIRHIFPSDTILNPYSFLVVFGGGSPEITGVNWQIASSGALGLNNDGDSVTLFDTGAQLVDQVAYGGIGNHDQSFTLFPDGEGPGFVLHSALEQTQGALFSPGTSVDGQLLLAKLEQDEPLGNPVVPEFPTLIYIALGCGSFLFKKL